MSSHDLVVVGGVGLLVSLPLSNGWKIAVSAGLFILGLVGRGLNLL